MRFKRLMMQSAVVSVAAIASSSSAQVIAPVLEIDFVTEIAGLPLSSGLFVAIAAVLAAAGGLLFRRRRFGSRLMTLLLGAAILGYAMVQLPLIGRAEAGPAPIALTLSSSPTIVTGPEYFGSILATNATGKQITIVGVSYNPGTYNYFISVAETTCVAGLELPPDGTCVIRIRSTG